VMIPAITAPTHSFSFGPLNVRATWKPATGPARRASRFACYADVEESGYNPFRPFGKNSEKTSRHRGLP